MVVSLDPGTNAEAAGLEVGDRITAVNGRPASFVTVTGAFPDDVTTAELTVISQQPLVVKRVRSELLKNFDSAPMGMGQPSSASPAASSFSLGNPGGAPFGGRSGGGAPKGSQRWEKERDRMGSCGLTVLTLRMSAMYVSGSVLFCLSKNAHSMGQGLHMQQRLGGFGGMSLGGSSRSLSVDQVCFSLSPDASLPVDTAKNAQISGAMAEALTSRQLTDFALCPVGERDDGGAGASTHDVFWT